MGFSMAEITAVLEFRRYEKSVACTICHWPCIACVFYCCGCKHRKLNLCPECCKEERAQYIKICEFCSLKEKVIDFSSFYKKIILSTK